MRPSASEAIRMLTRPRFVFVFLGACALTGFTSAAHAEQRIAEPAAEVAERIAVAKKELGAKAPTVVMGTAFVFTAPPGNEAALKSSVSFAKNVLDALTHDRFRALPSSPVTVVLFYGKASYDKYCKDVLGEPCISPFGFFRHDLRTIVMNAAPGLGTLSHELVHPLFEKDFPKGPIWINEGIASLYEAPALPKAGEIRGVKNWRHPRLVSALKSKTGREKARLDRLFGMTDDTFRGDDEDLHYALARYTCQWLESQGKLWTFYGKWRDNFVTDPTGERTFTEVMGKSPALLHDTFAKWVLAL